MNTPEDLALAQERHNNLVAFNLGPTPIYNERGQIIPIGEQVGRDGRVYKMYVVWRGRCIGIFFSWGTTSAMVDFFPGAAFQSFKTLEEAHRAWVNGPGWLPGWVPPAVARDPIITRAGLPHAVVDDTQQGTGGTTPPPSPPAPTISLSSSPSSIASSATFVSARNSSSPSICPQQKSATATVKALATAPRRSMYPSAPSSSRQVCPEPSAATAQLSPPSRSKSQTLLQAASRSVVNSPCSTTKSIATTTTSSIVVSEGRAYAVVVGDVPGVYIDKTTAFMMAGRHPGRQVRAFRSYSDAQAFFDREQASDRVGPPAFAHEVEAELDVFV